MMSPPDSPESSQQEPAGFQALFEKGLKYYEQEEFEQSLATFKDLTRFMPHASEVFLNLGNSHFKLEQLDEAEAAWKKAIELDPLEVTAYLNLGNLAFKQERISQAVYFWELYKTQNKRNATVWLNLGIAYDKLQEPELAMENYAVFLGLQAGTLEAARLKQRFDDAREVFEHNIKIGEKALIQGETERAKEIFAKALASYPGSAKIYKTYASLLYQNEELEESLKWYQKAYHRLSDDATILINMGVIFEKLNRHVDALWAYHQARELPSQERDKVSKRFEHLLSTHKSKIKEYFLGAQDLYRQHQYDEAEVRVYRVYTLRAYLDEPERTIKEWKEKVDSRRDPSLKAAKTYYNMGVDAQNQSRLGEALSYYNKYLKLQPDGDKATEVKCCIQEIQRIMGATVNALLDQDQTG